ncbi:MAG: DUF721 domain-containing protein [Candidatus Jordarchaeaceae archaeon]
MKTIAEAIEKLIRIYEIETPLKQQEILFRWSEIVGDVISKHATPEKVAYGKLYVKVDSPTWRNELVYRKSEILKCINETIKEAKIKEIIFR